MYIFRVSLFTLSIPCLCALVLTGCGSQELGDTKKQKSPTPPQENLTEVIDPKLVHEEVVSKLVNAGWTKEAAESVSNLNAKLFGMEKEAGSNLLDKTLNLLARLGDKPNLMAGIVKVPEVATLLATIEGFDDTGAEKVLESIPLNDLSERDVVLSLYGLFPTPKDSISLAGVLSTNKELVLRLWKRGEVLNFIGWMATDLKNQEANKLYKKWIRGVCEDALQNQKWEDAMDRANTVLSIHCEPIKALLEENESFRQHFESYWNEFTRLLNDQKELENWELFCSDPKVWAFYLEFNKEGQKAYSILGPIAISIVQKPIFAESKSKILSAILFANEPLIKALQDKNLADNPLFATLIRRKLPAGTLAKALESLGDKNAQPRLLAFWNTLADEALIKALGPQREGLPTLIPGYSLYALGEKIVDGREISNMDLIGVILDASEVIFIMRGATKIFKMTTKKLAADMVKNGTAKIATEAEKKAARNIYPMTLREGYAQSAKILKSISDKAYVDVSGIIKFAFNNTSVGQETFKRFTGLDARVFMRNDRMVIFDIPGLANSNHVIGRALRSTALNAGIDLVVSTPAVQEGIGEAIKGGTKVTEVSKTQMNAWRENLSIWWLAINDDSLQAPKKAALQK